MGIEICAYAESIGPVQINYQNFDKANILKTPTCMPDAEASADAEAYLQKCREELDSCGGVIACTVTNVPVGIGEPVFDKLDANLAKAMLSIGAVKAFEMGDGIASAFQKGSQNNDAFQMVDGKIKKITNHSGGTLGGMSDGDTLIFRAFVKPTPSIFKEQQTVNKSGEDITVQIKGRHDPIIVPRAVVVVECMAALTILDAMMMNMSSKLESLTAFYKK